MLIKSEDGLDACILSGLTASFGLGTYLVGSKLPGYSFSSLDLRQILSNKAAQIKALPSWTFSCVKQPIDSLKSSFIRIQSITCAVFNLAILPTYQTVAPFIHYHITPLICPPLLTLAASAPIVFIGTFICDTDPRKLERLPFFINKIVFVGGTFIGALYLSKKFTSFSFSRLELFLWSITSLLISIAYSIKLKEKHGSIEYTSKYSLASIVIASLVTYFIKIMPSTFSSGTLAAFIACTTRHKKESIDLLLKQICGDDKSKETKEKVYALISFSLAFIANTFLGNRMTRFIGGHPLHHLKLGVTSLFCGLSSAFLTTESFGPNTLKAEFRDIVEIPDDIATILPLADRAYGNMGAASLAISLAFWTWRTCPMLRGILPTAALTGAGYLLGQTVTEDKKIGYIAAFALGTLVSPKASKSLFSYKINYWHSAGFSIAGILPFFIVQDD